jgi:hypothetical protein
LVSRLADTVLAFPSLILAVGLVRRDLHVVLQDLVTDDGLAPDIIGRSGSTRQAQHGGS